MSPNSFFGQDVKHAKNELDDTRTHRRVPKRGFQEGLLTHFCRVLVSSNSLFAQSVKTSKNELDDCGPHAGCQNKGPKNELDE